MFAFSLALQLGCTVDELLDRVTAREFVEWQMFAKHEPFGTMADDVRAGLGPAIYVNSHKEKGARVVGPLDFIPWRNTPEFLAQVERAKAKDAAATAKPKTRREAALAAFGLLKKAFTR